MYEISKFGFPQCQKPCFKNVLNKKWENLWEFQQKTEKIDEKFQQQKNEKINEEFQQKMRNFERTNEECKRINRDEWEELCSWNVWEDDSQQPAWQIPNVDDQSSRAASQSRRGQHDVVELAARDGPTGRKCACISRWWSRRRGTRACWKNAGRGGEAKIYATQTNKRIVAPRSSLEFLRNFSYLLNAVLMRSQVGLEGLVLLLQRLDVVELALPVVLFAQALLFSLGPILMDVALVFEFLHQVIQPFQPLYFFP